jgi:hypothetical protein
MISSGSWQFDLSQTWAIPMSLLLLISLLLTLRGVTKRLFKRAPKRAFAVVLTNVIAYAAVYLLLLQPRIEYAADQAILLVTEGADLSDDRLNGAATLYVAPDAAGKSPVSKSLANANWLLDIEQLKLREPGLNTVEVLGFGLDASQWQHFADDLEIKFEPAAVSGFAGMRWQRSLSEGETLFVRGHYSQADNDAIIDIRLLDPASNVVGETRIKNGQDFELATRVKTRGHLEYTLQAWRSDMLLSGQVLPLEAGQGDRINIMIQQSAPSFETRALKAYAAAAGHRLRFQSFISKGKSVRQSANLSDDEDSTFSPAVLAGQDLLIIDGRSLAGLPATHRQWLQDAVGEGLGLLIMADSDLLKNFSQLDSNLLSGFNLAPLTGVELMVVPRLLKGGPRNWQQPVIAAGMELSADDADVLMDDGYGRSLVLKRASGLGHVSISLVGHVHSWLTAGHRADWGDYWSAMIEPLARQRDGSYLLPAPETGLFRVNRRVAVCAFSPGQDLSVTITPENLENQPTRLELELAVDNLNSPRRCAWFWPEASGWHLLELSAGGAENPLDRQAIYVFRDDQWTAEQRELRVVATRAKASGSNAEPSATSVKRTTAPLDVFWPWLILVLSATLLWLERKLDFSAGE